MQLLQVAEATETEWTLFVEERKTGIEEVDKLRQRVAEEESRRKISDSSEPVDVDMDGGHQNDSPAGGAEMELDDGTANKDESKASSLLAVEEKKEETTMIHADDDEAVEY